MVNKKITAFLFSKIFQELIHHAEKPSECVSNLMNCGVYIFSKAIKQIFIDERKKKLEVKNLTIF